MRRTLLRATALAFAAGALATLTIHAGLSACAPRTAAQAPPVAEPAAPPVQAAAPRDPLAPANTTARTNTNANANADDDGSDWRYMGATKAAPLFHPPRTPSKAQAPQQAQQPQQAAP